MRSLVKAATGVLALSFHPFVGCGWRSCVIGLSTGLALGLMLLTLALEGR